MGRIIGRSRRPEDEAGEQGVSQAGPCGTVVKRAAALAVSTADVERQRASLAVVCLYDGQMTRTGARESGWAHERTGGSLAPSQCC